MVLPKTVSTDIYLLNGDIIKKARRDSFTSAKVTTNLLKTCFAMWRHK